MLNFSNSGVTLGKFTLGLTLAAWLAACGGSSDSPASIVAVTDIAALAISPTTATTATAALTAAVAGFTFPAGVPALGTTSATTVKFTAPAAGTTTPGVSIAAGGGTATGTMSYGSCIFNIQTSTVPGIVAPTTIAVTPCAFDANTSGQNVTQGLSSAFITTATLLLGAASTSDGSEITVTVTNTGGVNTVTINGGTLGTVTGTIATGASS